jgi:hypothetical protein
MERLASFAHFAQIGRTTRPIRHSGRNAVGTISRHTLIRECFRFFKQMRRARNDHQLLWAAEKPVDCDAAWRAAAAPVLVRSSPMAAPWYENLREARHSPSTHDPITDQCRRRCADPPPQCGDPSLLKLLSHKAVTWAESTTPARARIERGCGRDLEETAAPRVHA